MSKFYIGEGRRLTDGDFVHLAKKHGIDEALLRAVNQVEARGKGSHSSGALVCLYEPHIAWRHTSGAVRSKLKAAGLAYSKWKRGNYPKTSFSRIDKCAAIAGEEVAALATSWGLGQIMGFNHKAAGFETALGMVRWFAHSEANQLEGMIRFIKANKKMLAAMRAAVPGDKESWRPFARPYNGAGYAKHNYHGRLANAHRDWVKKIRVRGPIAPPEQPQDARQPIPAFIAPAKQKPAPASPLGGFIGMLVKLITAIFGKKKE